MTKKDGIIREEQVHEPAPEQKPEASPSKTHPEEQHESDRIRNAHAAGLGAIGRNDERTEGKEEERGY